jgi:pimeloyl-ACP methyl ester carboxylesterase
MPCGRSTLSSGEHLPIDPVREAHPTDPRSGDVPAARTRLGDEKAGEAEPVVFLHGGVADYRMCDPPFTALSDSYRVGAVDPTSLKLDDVRLALYYDPRRIASGGGELS